MVNYISLVLSSVAIIVAVLDILINNIKASARQKKDRNIKTKVALLEQMYGTFDEISGCYINIMSSVEIRMNNIQKELLENGTDNNCKEYVLELNRLAKEALLFAVHKRKILDIYGIGVNADELAKHIVDVTKKIVLYVDIIVLITKLYVVKYHETSDSKLATQMVIKELEAERERSKLYYEYKDAWEIYLQYVGDPIQELVKDYDSVLLNIDDTEKRIISSGVSLVINGYINDLNKYGVEPFDKFEEQIVLAINNLMES